MALREIDTLAQTPVTSEDRLLVTENAAANLLSLAVQIALEVSSIIPDETFLTMDPLYSFTTMVQYSSHCICGG